MLLLKEVMESSRLTSPYSLNKEERVCMLGKAKSSFLCWFYVIIAVVAI